MELTLLHAVLSLGKSRVHVHAVGHITEMTAPLSFVLTQQQILSLGQVCNAMGMGHVTRHQGPVFVTVGILDLTATSVFVLSVQTTKGELA